CGDDGFLTVLSEGLVLSGIAMSIAGHTRPSSGACHEISHALDLLYPRRAASHGEQVGIGAAFATHLRGDEEGSRLMADVLRRHGLPVLAGEIGFDDDEFARAVEFAPQTRPGRYTILEHLDLPPGRIRAAYAEYTASVGG
ncbi:iron-containing alcohol dehydrogenase, partial [Streptomyces sp. SHP 1-2]